MLVDWAITFECFGNIMVEFTVPNKVKFDEVWAATSDLVDHFTTKTKDSIMVGCTSIIIVHYKCFYGNLTAQKFVNILKKGINYFIHKVQRNLDLDLLLQ